MSKTFSWSDGPDMGHTFSIIRPVLMRLLTDDEKAALEQHGCLLKVFPLEKYPLGHMVTFPDGTIMQPVTAIQSWVYFPDGYRCALIVSEGWYHLCLV